MARYEVFIPAASPEELNLTLRVTADSWMAALKIGLRKIGQGGMPAEVLCDVKEDESIHVTDPRSGRVFRILEIPEVSDPGVTAAPALPPPPAPAPVPAVPAVPPTNAIATPVAAAPAPSFLGDVLMTHPQGASAAPRDTTIDAPKLPPKGPERIAVPPPASEPELQLHRKIPRPFSKEPPYEPPKPPPAKKKKPKKEEVKVVEVPAPRKAPPKIIGRSADDISVEETLIELFEKTPAVFGKKREDALYFLLDLAMEKIPSDSGAVYVADLNRRDLMFAAVRGPKAQQLIDLGLSVPMGRGFVGFCAQEGVAVAISDAERDPRFYREISEKLGYATKSVLTTPILAGGRTLGAMQLINKKGSNTFTHAELSILHYMAHQAALYLEAQD